MRLAEMNKESARERLYEKESGAETRTAEF